MAKQKKNIIMAKTRGMIGDQIVFKKRAGKTYVAAAPDVDEHREPTTGQKVVHEKFRKSIEYAQLAIANADTKAMYAKKAERSQSAYNVAFRDAFSAPQVVNIIAVGYTGQPGGVIIVHAKDDFKVVALKVSIYNSDGNLIEEGPAEAQSKDRIWSYAVTQSNPNVEGTTIRATAFDIPENEGHMEVTL